MSRASAALKDLRLLTKLSDQFGHFGPETLRDVAPQSTIASGSGPWYPPSREAAADWIDANQLGRRNLTPDQISLLRGRLHERRKLSHAQAQARATPPTWATLAPAPQGRTREQLAEEFGVSPNTIKRDAAFARAVEAP